MRRVAPGRPVSTGRPPVPGQKLRDSIDRMIGDAADDVAQIGLGVEPVHLRGLCDPRTMPSGAVFPIIHRDVGVRDSA